MRSVPRTPSPGFRLNPWLIRLPILVIMATVLTVIILAILLSAYQIAIAGSIVPGISAYGVSLGGLTMQEATQQLDAAFTYDDETVFTFRHGEQFWQVTAGELGVAFDAAATAQAAFDAGHDGTPVANLFQQAQIWTRGHSITPMITYDATAAQAWLAGIVSEIERPALAATLTINGAEVTTTAGQVGVQVDRAAALSDLEARITALEPGGEIQLIVSEIQPQSADVESTAAYIRTAVSAPLTLTARDAEGNPLGPWLLSPEQIAAMLDVTLINEDNGGGEYAVDIDMSGLVPYLETLAPGLIIPAQNGQFVFDDATGELEALVPAVNGRELNAEATVAALEEAVFSLDNRTVELQFDFVLPRYHNDITAAELGITEKVSSSRTFYTGSTAARRFNIEHGASFYNGVIIGPGEMFSFNELVGDISEETGFVEGAIIFGGRTVRGVGGGVCQVSTTAYRAAFFGGYPIVERYSHGYRVGYYELANAGPGLDAAIFTPTADFKFLNDTDYHLLIETEFMPDIDAVEFRFYSTNPGRTVEVSEPILRNVVPPTATIYEVNNNLQPGQQLQVDWAQEGGDVIITRIIRDLDGNILERRDYATFYQPWSAVIQVPPGDSRLS